MKIKAQIAMVMNLDKCIGCHTCSITCKNVWTNRAGITPAKIHMKLAHVIGGYGQLSYGFNYYGPTGNQRDIYIVARKMEEVDWLED